MKTRLVILLFIAAITTGAYHFLDLNLGSLIHGVKNGKDSSREESFEDLPQISFPMLDQTRPRDLIDMDLEFPESLKELDGRRVSLVGFMAPFDDLKDMRRCMIVPSYVGCTFCSPPNLSQVVFVTQGGKDETEGNFPFIEEASKVSGTLRISLAESRHEGQKHGFLYSLENATISPHDGEGPVRAPGHGTPGNHTKGKESDPLPEIAWSELIHEISEILGQEPRYPIRLEPVSPERFEMIIRSDLETDFPEAGQAQAFSLLGFFPEESGWLDTLTQIQLKRRLALANEQGSVIYLLNSVPENHPYIRLSIVGEIAEAIARQTFPLKRKQSEAEGRTRGNDDSRRADMALRQGLNALAIYRYARSRGISTSGRPPDELLKQGQAPPNVPGGLYHWFDLPRELGPFLVDFLVGSTGPLAAIESAFEQPPSTTMEFFRPLWYQDASLWRPDPVVRDFADGIMDTSPAFTNVLGVGGLISWLSQWYGVSEARALAGHWAGDRWALWEFSDNDSVLLLETRWHDEGAARRFQEAIPYHPHQRVLRREKGSNCVRLFRGSSESALTNLGPEEQAAPQQGTP
jgi:hypothetical protein